MSENKIKFRETKEAESIEKSCDLLYALLDPDTIKELNSLRETIKDPELMSAFDKTLNKSDLAAYIQVLEILFGYLPDEAKAAEKAKCSLAIAVALESPTPLEELRLQYDNDIAWKKIKDWATAEAEEAIRAFSDPTPNQPNLMAA